MAPATRSRGANRDHDCRGRAGDGDQSRAPRHANLADAGSTTVSLTPAGRSSIRPRSGRSSTRTRLYRRRARIAPPVRAGERPCDLHDHDAVIHWTTHDAAGLAIYAHGAREVSDEDGVRGAGGRRRNRIARRGACGIERANRRGLAHGDCAPRLSDRRLPRALPAGRHRNAPREQCRHRSDRLRPVGHARDHRQRRAADGDVRG